MGPPGRQELQRKRQTHSVCPAGIAQVHLLPLYDSPASRPTSLLEFDPLYDSNVHGMIPDTTSSLLATAGLSANILTASNVREWLSPPCFSSFSWS
ncbi:hypothetical protein AVEN_120511-1 [Araneus ventricosus]|uniref:Uncharacterized protein n=1 Tax=Araneus ventricosus TaxID=182803 RepID=A0A4Y2MQK7_ARAVE|nr:hypothetical protein AVEN_120511-1 [Araneus ventricosus]